MQKRLPLIIVVAVIGLALMLFAFWPTSGDDAVDGNTVTGSVQQVTVTPERGQSSGGLTQAHAQTASLKGVVDNTGVSNLQDQFHSASKLIADGKYEDAKSTLEKLIQTNPKTVEAYINLASIHAEQGDLERARSTLSKGINASPSYVSLYSSWQKLHGAMAAKAYQLALSEQSDVDTTVGRVELPIVQLLGNSENNEPSDLQRQELASLENELNVARTAIAQQKLALEQKQLSETQLLAANSQIGKLQQQLLQNEQAVADNGLTSQENSSKIQLLNQAVNSKDELIAALKVEHATEIDSLNSQLAENKQRLLVALAGLDSLQASRTQTQQDERDRAAQALAAEQKAKSTAKAKQKQNAIAVVNSWARAWSAQNVQSYISHYRDGYAPSGSGLTNSQWVEQRRIRLTNKPFIEVKVSQFDVIPTGSQLRVVFSQHYKSNNLDDKIRKQLTLASDGGDWSNAKIVAERVLRR